MSSSSGNKRKRSSPSRDDASLLHDICRIEYDQGVLDDLLQYYMDKAGTSSDAGPASAVHDMYCCTRAYEESYLREPTGSERACGRDQMCEGKCLTGTDGFVLREFLYPGQAPSEQRSLCLLCRRYEISRMYFKFETNVESYSHHNVRIADHYNLVGVPGEYDIRDCIVSGEHYTGLPMPVVLHIRSAYTVFTKDGVKYLQQTRLRCPGTADKDSTDTSGSFLTRRATLAARVAPSNNSVQVRST